LQLGIELDLNPPKTPHLKGTVDSFFDGLNDQLSASLPERVPPRGFGQWIRMFPGRGPGRLLRPRRVLARPVVTRPAATVLIAKQPSQWIRHNI